MKNKLTTKDKKAITVNYCAVPIDGRRVDLIVEGL